MKKSSIKIPAIILSALLANILFLCSVSAYKLESVSIREAVAEDLSAYETIKFYITNNTDSMFSFRAPRNSYDIRLYAGMDGSNPASSKLIDEGDKTINIPLECRTCSLQVSYKLNGVMKPSDGIFSFYRTLNFPKNPYYLNFTVIIPPDYILARTDESDGLPVAPIPDETRADASGIAIRWSETEPELPKVYHITLKNHEDLESSTEEFFSELSEHPVWIIIIITLLLSMVFGAFSGVAIYKKLYHEKNKKVYIPSCLLSPDEKTVLKLLKENSGSMNQKEVGARLNWSKSKVSAIMSNLQYKEMIKREKFGRNYKIEVIKDVEDW